MPNVSTVKGTLAADLATGGTITIGYPNGTSRGNFIVGVRHRVSMLGKVFNCPENITLAFNATTVVVTYNGATTIPAGTAYRVELDRNTTNNPLPLSPIGVDALYMKTGLNTPMYPLPLVLFDLGSPTALSATAVCAAQAIAGAVSAVINGAKAVNGVASLGAATGRALKIVSSNAGDTTQVVSITGTDLYGNTVHQNLTLNGTTVVTGTRAFYTVTSVTVSAAMAGNLSVGDTDVLGLPAYLSNAAFVLKELQDGAAATAGTFVVGLGITAAATLTNGDVRGTYVPNAATDGSKGYAIVVALPEPSFYGQPQP